MAASRGSRGKKLERSRKAGSATRVKKKEKDSPRPVLVKKKNISKREVQYFPSLDPNKLSPYLSEECVSCRSGQFGATRTRGRTGTAQDSATG